MDRHAITPRVAVAAAIVAVVLADGGCVRRPRRPVFSPINPPGPDLVLKTWLSKTCKVGEDNDLERYMRNFGPQITPGLLAALANGPPEEQRIAVYNHSSKQLLQMQAKLDALGLPERDANWIRSLKPEDYSRKAVDDFVQAYKSSALAGLAVAGTPEAKAQLQKEAANSDSPFSGIARKMLGPDKSTTSAVKK
jgi:hypothetical protein